MVRGLERVFGHAELEVVGDGGRVGVRFRVTHGARLIESRMCGRGVGDVPYIASRICGACSIAHCLASVRALEDALGLKVDEGVETLRDVINAIQVAQNHVMHLALLALPDYGYAKGLRPSPLVKRALRINAACLTAINILAGRIVNPTTIAIGGLRRRVSRDSLLKAADALSSVAGDAEKLLAEVASIDVPRLKEPPSYCLSIRPSCGYLTHGSEIIAFSKVFGSIGFSVKLYGDHLEREVVPYSNSKHITVDGRPAFTGPRARVTIHRDSILGRLGRAAELLEGADLSNPFTNLLAEAAEVLYVLRWAPETLRCLNVPAGPAEVRERFSIYDDVVAGAACVEAPRGVLIHRYVVSGGRVVEADIITPTQINAKHIEVCGEALAREALASGTGLEGLEAVEEALVRSYDPCLPCAVHVIRLGGV